MDICDFAHKIGLVHTINAVTFVIKTSIPTWLPKIKMAANNT